GRDKKFFYIFDWCRNFEFFNENPEVAESAGPDSLAKRLFTARVEIVGELDGKTSESPAADGYGQEPTPHGHVGEPRSEPDRAAAVKNLRDYLVSCGRIAGRGFGNEPRQFHRPAAAALCGEIQHRRGMGESRCRRAP